MESGLAIGEATNHATRSTADLLTLLRREQARALATLRGVPTPAPTSPTAPRPVLLAQVIEVLDDAEPDSLHTLLRSLGAALAAEQAVPAVTAGPALSLVVDHDDRSLATLFGDAPPFQSPAMRPRPVTHRTRHAWRSATRSIAVHVLLPMSIVMSSLVGLMAWIR